MKATASVLVSLVLFCIIQAGVSRSLLGGDLQHHLNKCEGLEESNTNTQAPMAGTGGAIWGTTCSYL